MRFYVSPQAIYLEKNLIKLTDKKELHHMRDVMRLKKAELVTIFDGKGKEYLGDIKEISRDSVIIEIRKTIDCNNTIPYKVTLYQAIPKRWKMDFIIEKAVELGVDNIVPIVTERTEVNPAKEKSLIKIERWNRLLTSASKQCGRVKLPRISGVKKFSDALVESEKSDLVIFAALNKDSLPLEAILKRLNPKTIAVFIGPEGDFSPDEISMAKRKGYSISSLGRFVLRVETAAIYVLSCLGYEYANEKKV